MSAYDFEAGRRKGREEIMAQVGWLAAVGAAVTLALIVASVALR